MVKVGGLSGSGLIVVWPSWGPWFGCFDVGFDLDFNFAKLDILVAGEL